MGNGNVQPVSVSHMIPFKSLSYDSILSRGLTRLRTFEIPNLKIYNRYQNQCIRNAKKDYHVCEFTNYIGDIRKTLDTVRTSLTRKKENVSFSHVLGQNEHISGAQNIANQFNEYFTDTGSGTLNQYLKILRFLSQYAWLHSNSSLFQETNPTDIAKIICQQKPKSNAGYIYISSKLWTRLLIASCAH